MFVQNDLMVRKEQIYALISDQFSSDQNFFSDCYSLKLTLTVSDGH